MVSAWRNFKNIFSRPLLTITFRSEMLKFYPYFILTADTMVEFVIFWVLRSWKMAGTSGNGVLGVPHGIPSCAASGWKINKRLDFCRTVIKSYNGATERKQMSKVLGIDAVKCSALTAQLGFNVGNRYLDTKIYRFPILHKTYYYFKLNIIFPRLHMTYDKILK